MIAINDQRLPKILNKSVITRIEQSKVPKHKRGLRIMRNPLNFLVVSDARLELATSGSGDQRSIHLS